jgi:hypothetical protein
MDGINKLMRTTVRLPDELMRRAKRYATEHGMTLTAILLTGLSETIGKGTKEANPARGRRMPIFHGTGVRPGVNLTSTSSLLALTEKRHGSS